MGSPTGGKLRDRFKLLQQLGLHPDDTERVDVDLSGRRALVIATNQNDILHRTMQTGAYTKAEVVPSISPSMDIQVSSNFERALFDA